MKPLLLIFLLASIISCSRDDDSGLTITAGFACGWGAGQDSLVITRSDISYVYYVPAQSQQPKIRASRSTTESEWHEIADAVNYNDFLELNYNTCNICVDGCDEWISLHDTDIDHSIKFTKGQEIGSIKKLQEIIARLRAEFAK